MRINTRTIALGLAVAALGLSPAAALAKHGAAAAMMIGGIAAGPASAKDGEVIRRGSCTGASDWKLKAKPDDGRLEVEFEVDQNRNDVRWKVRARRDGKLVIKTSAVTQAPSGSFSVERRIADPAGSNRIAARATSPSGEVCKAALTI